MTISNASITGNHASGASGANGAAGGIGQAGAPGTAGTDFAIVSQLPSSRDRRSAALGLLGQPFDFGAINDVGLGLTTGFLILMLCRPDAGTVAGFEISDLTEPGRHRLPLEPTNSGRDTHSM